MHAEANSCRTRGLCPTERLCTPAVTGSGDLASLQLVQHLESGCSQEQRSGSVPDAECGLTAAAEAWQTNVCGPQAEPLSDVPASTLQHKGIAQLKQNSGLLSPRMGADAQLQLATGDAAALRLQSTSHLNVEGVTQQHTDECSDVYASENPEQHQFMSAAQCLSSSEPQQPSAELNVVAAAAAAESDDQAVWPAAVLGDVPTSLRDDKSSSGDLASDACSGDHLLVPQQLTTSPFLFRMPHSRQHLRFVFLSVSC